MNKDYMNRISIVSAALTILVAICAFVLSFDALEQLVRENNIFQRPFSYLFPVIIDAAMVAFSLSAFRKTLAGEPAKWQWLLIVSFTVFSMLFNSLHASAKFSVESATGWVVLAIAAFPPFVVFLMFETFVDQMRTAVKSNINNLQAVIKSQHGTIQTMKVNATERNAQIEAMQTTIDKLQERSSELTQAKRQITRLEKQIEELQGEMVVPASVGDAGRDLLRVIDEQMTQKEWCERYNENASWTSRTISKLNGGTKNE